MFFQDDELYGEFEDLEGDGQPADEEAQVWWFGDFFRLVHFFQFSCAHHSVCLPSLHCRLCF